MLHWRVVRRIDDAMAKNRRPERESPRGWLWRRTVPMNFGFGPAGSTLRAEVSGVVLSALLVLGALSSSSLRAQSNVDGYIYGNVTGVVAGATVIAANKDTGLRREAMVDAWGSFQFTALPAGIYRVTLHVAGEEDQVADNVWVRVGTGAAVRFAAGVQAKEKIVVLAAYTVSGDHISPIDFSSLSTSTVLRAEMIAGLPVERDTTSVALLVPGASRGASGGTNNADFHALASIDGSSVAENSYFVNGFNLTNFRNGMGGGSVPFEFYDQFKIEEGGYSAEYGRSTGGVIEAVTKRGGNTFLAGVNVFIEPDSLRAKSPDVYLPQNGGIVVDSRHTIEETANANIWASGPIVRNKLFYYVLYNARHEISDSSAVATYNRSSTTDPFWGAKLDWIITDKQTLGFTAISDRRRLHTDTLDFDEATGTFGPSHSRTYSDRGGRDYIANYHGDLFSNFSLDALYGHSRATQADISDAQYVLDARVVPNILYGDENQPAAYKDSRAAFRLDASLRFDLMGSHVLRFGYDREDTTSESNSHSPGDGLKYRYYNVPPGGIVNGVQVPAGTTEYVSIEDNHNKGTFKTISGAYYLDDSWKLLANRLVLSLGLRNDAFNNENSLGQTFVKLTNQWAPRFSVTYDLAGDHTTKLFANYGRYTMPVASNTNIRFSGGEFIGFSYYTFTAINPATHVPTLGTQLGPSVVLPGEGGAVIDPKTNVSQVLKPMYQDEYIVGLQHDFGRGWVGSIRGTYRRMTSFIEDAVVEINPSGVPGNGYLFDVLTNPGRTMVFYGDIGNGLQKITLTPPEQTYLGQTLPAAMRKYYAVDLSLEKSGNGKWFVRGSYTWSHSYGNDEGLVLSDLGQEDAGMTELFDFPQLMDGRHGNLYNDHRHRFKVFGTCKFGSQWQVGANYLLQSGNPKLALGYYPGVDPYGILGAYGAAFFYNNGQLVPRGSLGTTPWLQEIDLSVRYTPKWGRQKLTFGLDVFNALNSHVATTYASTAETGGSGLPYSGFGQPVTFQDPFYLRLSASYKY
jgi:hypothetical protein